MQVQLNLDSENPIELSKAKRILAILEGNENKTTQVSVGAQELDQSTLSTVNADTIGKIAALVRTTTGGPLAHAARHYQAGQQFRLSELGKHLGWNASKSVSWFAKFSRTCKAWKVRPLLRHDGYPKRYSMTEEVREAILQAIDPEKGSVDSDVR